MRPGADHRRFDRVISIESCSTREIQFMIRTTIINCPKFWFVMHLVTLQVLPRKLSAAITAR
jgi:hypothetical protein